MCQRAEASRASQKHPINNSYSPRSPKLGRFLHFQVVFFLRHFYRFFIFPFEELDTEYIYLSHFLMLELIIFKFLLSFTLICG